MVVVSCVVVIVVVVSAVVVVVVSVLLSDELSAAEFVVSAFDELSVLLVSVWLELSPQADIQAAITNDTNTANNLFFIITPPVYNIL